MYRVVIADPTPEGFWHGRTVLVTGHTGFKGAWLSLWLQRLGAQVCGLALPPAHSAGAFHAMGPWDDLDHRIVDVRDRAALTAAVTALQPEVVFHLAAQSQVGHGIRQPVETYATNVLGTAHLLDALGTAGPALAVVVVTSDKVYRNTGRREPFREGDELGGEDPYSSSKACAELVVRAWRGLQQGPLPSLATARAGNIIGGGDRAEERLLPDVFTGLEQSRPVRLRAPRAVRPWQFVLDPLYGYLELARRLVEQPADAPEAVNFGPEHSVAVADVVDRVHRLWGAGQWLPADTTTYEEAPTLLLDSGLARSALAWRCRLDLDAALRWTVDWHRAQLAGDDMRRFSSEQIAAYERLVA
jgi:CDP-glucose 4,6-dehydratase